MKGQMVFEFIIAAMILFAIVIYIINYISYAAGIYHSDFISSYLESRALQVSEVLMSDPEKGLVTEWPLLSQGRMSSFNVTCNQKYLELLDNFGLREQLPYSKTYHLSVLVVSSSGKKYVDCGRTPPEKVTSAMVTRFGMLPSRRELAMVEVAVW
jgi:hypothetical protein